MKNIYPTMDEDMNKNVIMSYSSRNVKKNENSNNVIHEIP